MNNLKQYGLINLAKKSLAVITTSLGLLSSNQSIALPQISNKDEDGDNSKSQKVNKTILKPKLILKLKSNNPEDYLLAQHRSHSSHSSHSSHRSHYSSSSGSDDGGGGLGIGVVVVGGLIAYGAYQLGKSKNKK